MKYTDEQKNKLIELSAKYIAYDAAKETQRAMNCDLEDVLLAVGRVEAHLIVDQLIDRELNQEKDLAELAAVGLPTSVEELEFINLANKTE